MSRRLDDPTADPPPGWIRLGQRATGVACVAAAVAVVGVGVGDGVRSRPPAGPGARWLSELTPVDARQGWGTLGRDRSVGGGPLSLDGTYHLRGVGTHAPATLVYAIPEGSATFEALVGIDDVTGDEGSVRVSIAVDGDVRYASPVLTPGEGSVPVRIDVAGARRLTIEVDPTGDGRRSDHLDLALARFTVEGPEASGARRDRADVDTGERDR